MHNHLLQVAGSLALAPPATTYHESIRDEPVKVFRQVRPLDRGHLVRGQFQGYRGEPGVAPDSEVERFAAMRLEIDSWRWDGVPFFIRAGKCLPVTTTEAIVELKRPPLTRLAPGKGNYLRLRLSPELNIALGALVKVPGEAMAGKSSELSLVHRPEGEEMSAYERLLGDAVAGDSTPFARQDAVEAGSWGTTVEADRLAVDVGDWGRPGGSSYKPLGASVRPPNIRV